MFFWWGQTLSCQFSHAHDSFSRFTAYFCEDYGMAVEKKTVNHNEKKHTVKSYPNFVANSIELASLCTCLNF